MSCKVNDTDIIWMPLNNPAVSSLTFNTNTLRSSLALVSLFISNDLFQIATGNVCMYAVCNHIPLLNKKHYEV